MTFPPLTTILVMYVTAVGFLWTATRIFAPTGNKVSILRCLGAAIAMTILGNASRKFLDPLVGSWYLLVALLTYVLVAKALFSLGLWRSMLVALIYIVGVAAVYYLLFSRTVE
jgi:uncharacterized membrane protein